VLGRDSLAYCGNHIGPVVALGPLDFRHDDQAFPPGKLHGKGGHGLRLNAFVGPLYGEFDILRITIHPADDDEVLDSPCNIELVVEHEAEIAGAEERPFVRAFKACVEGFFGSFGIVPIALGDAGAANPNLADFIAQELPARIRIDDAHLLIGQHAAAAD
jgi:hypothetical protein